VKIIGVGLNYRDHAREVELELPKQPLLFAKWPNALIRDGETIVIPAGVGHVDYEAELAAVIGERVKGVSVENALEAVAGYACLNDVSARELQFADGQWTRGKSIDTFCPMGPIVPRDDVGDPQNLAILCRVNGETVQHATTADMVFGVDEIIAFISETITLEPGDIIATGTPPGVAMGKSADGKYLQPGDVVEVEIERIGVLRNPVA
jgi:5-carboxymethyl-2-hydroxymuconate isomerase